MCVFVRRYNQLLLKGGLSDGTPAVLIENEICLFDVFDHAADMVLVTAIAIAVAGKTGVNDLDGGIQWWCD